ncbi:alkaline phosphatase [Amylibacter ulvae]|uniref:Alkaline phosphatase n=1 Tax=Paramylibacter ulvae TaxID=1651968 RepID=A0ABQ3D5T8_9RHOB|nr:esterase-like activity of phytase family protein [Amylibacter ulvae]GHA57519.1 alkaline phosphatase [Amylibacter ulvae]
MLINSQSWIAERIGAAAIIIAASFTADCATADSNFNRISSFATPSNMAAGEDLARETSPEIITATADGMRLVYTDSPLGALGMVDISDPHAPKPLGNIAMNGEPTSVALAGTSAFVGVNTSASYTAPSGLLKTINIDTKSELASCDIGGQPDSIAIAKDGSFIAVAIENERDEDLDGGVIPQMPAGALVTLQVKDGVADCESLNTIAMTNLAQIAGSDPEPEFVDINALGETVVTMQENNHIAVVAKDGRIISHFAAGTVTLNNVDLKRDGALTFDETATDVRREPDAVKWLDNDHFITANEGDYKGGSRSWTVFRKDGTVVYESGESFEHALIQAGHYPEKRSGKKGVEPESVEVGMFNGTPYAFIGSERGSIVAVYNMSNPAEPVLKQLLPSGIAPEGIVAIPSRNLLVTANEADLIEDGGIRAHVMTYELGEGVAQYPSITSAGADELIGWGALSGLAADSETPGKLYAVNDSFYGMLPSIFEIDATATPAKITRAIPITRFGQTAQKLDMEGITLDGNGGFWIASEGRTDRVIPHAIYNVNAKGEIIQEIGFPAELLAVEKRFGAEGITLIDDTLWIAIQREWKDDPADHVKLVSYNLETKEWGAVLYPKAKPDTGWTGLSEITAFGDSVYVIERDNQIGQNAVTKKLYRIPISDMKAAKLGETLPVVTKEEVRDFIPDLAAGNGYVQDKLEGFAIDAAGVGFAVTDNDGIDDHSGETHFINIGTMTQLN